MALSTGPIELQHPKAACQMGRNTTQAQGCSAPTCVGCLFGAMTKVTWYTRGQHNQGTVFVVIYPGQCTLVDQFQSTQVELINQLKGMFTNQWCQCDTVFIDHFFKIVTDQCSAQTLKENQAYKQIISKCRVRIHHYPCNNGHFVNNALKQLAEQQQQMLTFCGINAHF